MDNDSLIWHRADASRDALPKLFCSLGAIAAGTKAIDCFNSIANAAYQQLTAPKEHRQLSPPVHWE
jgi:hypothetical protein